MSCENCEESAYVIDKLAKLLAEIAVIVNGVEPHDTSWSYHDLPEKVRALKQAQQPAAAVPAAYALIGDGFAAEPYFQLCADEKALLAAVTELVGTEPADDGHDMAAAIASELLATGKHHAEDGSLHLHRVAHPPAALAVPDAAALAARLDKALGCHADSMPKEAYFEVDAVMRALLAQQPAAAVPEGYALVPVQSLRWWRELAEINPQDLVPRIDAMLAAARKGE